MLLADALEASTRSLPNLTPDGLEAHIEKIVEGRVREGDLAESELSLREIGAIREAFAVTMRGAMHGRIAYPDAGKVADDNDWVAQTLGDRRRTNGGSDGAQVATKAKSSQNREGDATNGAPSKRERRRALQNANSGTSNSPTQNAQNGAAAPPRRFSPRAQRIATRVANRKAQRTHPARPTNREVEQRRVPIAPLRTNWQRKSTSIGAKRRSKH